MSLKSPWILILLLVTVVFTTQNYEVVRVKFLFWNFSTSKAIVLFLTLLAGIVIGWSMTLRKK